MSWSISAIGSPASICKAIDKQSQTLNGVSKVEFDETMRGVKDILSGIKRDVTYGGPSLYHLQAHGSGGHTNTGEMVNYQTNVKIEQFHNFVGND